MSSNQTKHPTAAERQKALNEISEADRQKIESKTSESLKVDPEWMLLAEFGLMYGWQALLDAKEDRITGAEMMLLITAGRKVQSGYQYDQTLASFIGAVAAGSKNPGSQFGKLTKQMLKKAQAD